MIKPIETVYQGYRFRSRLEARWAVFFDAMGVRWEYEKEGYHVPKHGYYLPDFWLPDLLLWYEVKGEINWFSKKTLYTHNGQNRTWTYEYSPELELMTAFRDAQEWPVACAVGPIGNHQIYFYAWDCTDGSAGSYADENSFWCVSNGIATLNVNPIRGDRVIMADNLMGGDLPHFTYSRDYGFDARPALAAGRVARQARFEHGERPNVSKIRAYSG